MFCTKFGDNCSKSVGGVVKKTDLDEIQSGGKSVGMAYMDRLVWTHRMQEKKIVSETYGSKVTGQKHKLL